VNVYGKLFGNNIEYSLAVMNGQGRNNNDGNSQKDFAGRLSYHPLPWLTLSSSIILGTGNVAVTESTTAPKRYICTSAPEVTGFKSNGNFTRNRYAAGLCIENKYLGLSLHNSSSLLIVCLCQKILPSIQFDSPKLYYCLFQIL
jgi:hypothetical protein